MNDMFLTSAATTIDRGDESDEIIDPGVMRQASIEVVVEGNQRLTLQGELLEQVRQVLMSSAQLRTHPQDELLTPDEAAKALEVSRQTIYAWQDLGILGRVNRANRRLVPSKDLAAAQQRYENNRKARARYKEQAAERVFEAEPPLGQTTRKVTPRMRERAQRLERQAAEQNR